MLEYRAIYMKKLMYVQIVVLFLTAYLFLSLIGIQAQSDTPTVTLTPAPSETPTPSSTTAPTPTMTPGPTNTPVPNATNTPTFTPTPTSQVKATISPTPTIKYIKPTLPMPTLTPTSSPTIIPAEISVTPFSQIQTQTPTGLSNGLIFFILISTGGILLGVAVFLRNKELKKNRNNIFS